MWQNFRDRQSSYAEPAATLSHLAHHVMSPADCARLDRASLAHGTVVASFNIESFSLGRLRTLTRADLDARYREYVSMVRV